MRKHSPAEGGCWRLTRDLAGPARSWPSQVTGDSLCSGTLNRCPIIAPEALSKPPHWSLGLRSFAASREEVRLAPHRPRWGEGSALPCSAAPVSPQAGVKVQSAGLQPSASPRAGQLRAAGWGEGAGGSCAEGSLGGSHRPLRAELVSCSLDCLRRRGLCRQGGKARVATGGGLPNASIQAATPPAPFNPLWGSSLLLLGFSCPDPGCWSVRLRCLFGDAVSLPNPVSGSHTPRCTLNLPASSEGPASLWPLYDPVICCRAHTCPWGLLVQAPCPTAWVPGCAAG